MNVMIISYSGFLLLTSIDPRLAYREQIIDYAHGELGRVRARAGNDYQGPG